MARYLQKFVLCKIFTDVFDTEFFLQKTAYLEYVSVIIWDIFLTFKKHDRRTYIYIVGEVAGKS